MVNISKETLLNFHAVSIGTIGSIENSVLNLDLLGIVLILSLFFSFFHRVQVPSWGNGVVSIARNYPMLGRISPKV